MDIDVDEIAHHLEYQEDVLQQTRNLHYLFQGLLLGIGLLSCTTTLTLLFTAPNISKGLLFVAVVFCIFAAFCFYTGTTLCKDYAERILTRGRIVDMMQHVQLLKAMNKLRFLEDYLSNHTQNAKISYLVKIAEGIVPSDTKSGSNSFYYKRKNLEASQGLLEWIYFVQCENDIFNLNYVDSLGNSSSLKFNISGKTRKISETRSGHQNLFRMLWRFVGVFSLIAIVVTGGSLLPTSSIRVGSLCFEFGQTSILQSQATCD